MRGPMFTNEAFYIFRVIVVFKLNRGGRIQGQGEGVKILIFREDSASTGGVLSPPLTNFCIRPCGCIQVFSNSSPKLLQLGSKYVNINFDG